MNASQMNMAAMARAILSAGSKKRLKGKKVARGGKTYKRRKRGSR